jgi:hypothetical protein
MSFTQSHTFTQLKSVFRGDLISSADSDYRESLKRWSVLAEKPAGLVAFVKDEDDVSAAVKFGVKAKLEIAIKGRSLLIITLSRKGELTNRWWTQPLRIFFNQRRHSYRSLEIPQ